jgi:hypothetical protein
MCRTIPLYGAVLTALSFTLMAQAPPPNSYYQPQAPSQGQQFSPQELSNLVAPIALYPDLLLSEVLAASTYPLELVQAQQWMQANPGLRGPDLVNAAKQQNWDPSVQALVAFPDVMNILTRDIQWTTELGNAFLAQQAAVMDAVQQLRASARSNGRLTDTPQQRVTLDQENGQSAIVIQPTDPQVVYPPVYNPEYVWGPPVYGAYPPLAYPAPGYGITYAVGAFLGVLFSGLLSFGGWGWGLSWLTHGLFLNSLFFSHFGFHGFGGPGYYAGRGYASHVAWVHDPGHRLGVPYGNRSISGRYAGGSYNTGRSAYFGSGSESSRQMQAYRGLAARESRGNGYSGYGSRPNYSGSSYGGVRNSASSFRSESRSSSKSFSSPHYSAPKASGHFGGRGHSGGGGHNHSGGGHSHGGSHKK